MPKWEWINGKLDSRIAIYSPPFYQLMLGTLKIGEVSEFSEGYYVGYIFDGNINKSIAYNNLQEAKLYVEQAALKFFDGMGFVPKEAK